MMSESQQSDEDWYMYADGSAGGGGWIADNSGDAFNDQANPYNQATSETIFLDGSQMPAAITTLNPSIQAPIDYQAQTIDPNLTYNGVGSAL